MDEWIFFFYNGIVALSIITMQFLYFARFVNGKVNWRRFGAYAVLAYGAVHFSNVMESAVLSLACMILLLIVWGKFVFQSDLGAAALFALLTVESMQLSFGAFASFTAILSPLFFSSHSHLIGLAFMILSTVASLGLGWLCYIWIGRVFSNQHVKQNQYLMMILTPLFLIFLAGEYIVNTVYGNTITMDEQGNILGANHAQMLLIQSFCLGSLFCLIHVYKKLLEKVALEIDILRLQQETHFQKAYIEDAKARYEKTRSFRHDIKNHLSVLQGLMQQKEHSKAEAYLKELEVAAAGTSFPCHTNHPILDILISDKVAVAEQAGIRMECMVRLPDSCQISAMDLCTVFANALDNATHGCIASGDPALQYIRVTGRQQGVFFLLEFINGCLDVHGEVENGIGLASIQTVAHKYHGAMEAVRTGNMFQLHVMLVISQQICDISERTPCIAGGAD